jgi:hypothetical protein
LAPIEIENYLYTEEYLRPLLEPRLSATKLNAYGLIGLRLSEAAPADFCGAQELNPLIGLVQ